MLLVWPNKVFRLCWFDRNRCRSRNTGRRMPSSPLCRDVCVSSMITDAEESCQRWQGCSLPTVVNMHWLPKTRFYLHGLFRNLIDSFIRDYSPAERLVLVGFMGRLLLLASRDEPLAARASRSCSADESSPMQTVRWVKCTGCPARRLQNDRLIVPICWLLLLSEVASNIGRQRSLVHRVGNVLDLWTEKRPSHPASCCSLTLCQLSKCVPTPPNPTEWPWFVLIFWLWTHQSRSLPSLILATENKEKSFHFLLFSERKTCTSANQLFVKSVQQHQFLQEAEIENRTRWSEGKTWILGTVV